MRHAFLGLALAAMLSAPLSAQLRPTQETGSRIYTEPQKVDDPAATAHFSKRVASCVHFRMDERDLQRFLRSSDPVTTRLEGTGLSWEEVDHAIEDCMGTRFGDYRDDIRLAKMEISFTHNRLRGLLLEEAYLDQHTAPFEIGETAAEMTNRAYVSTGEALASAKGLGNFADCVIYRDATAADAMLRTAPGSPEELAAARALRPHLSGCLFEGQTIELTPASVRGLVADGLWTRATYGSQEVMQ